MSKLPRQDLQSPNRDASIARRREMLERQVNPEQLDDETLATFLLEQEIQPSVAHEPRTTIRVPMR